jgi:acyl dehydratase
VGGAEGIPPTFVTAAEFLTFPDVLGDPNLGLDFARVLHASETFDFHRPLALGASLTVDTSIASIRRKGANGFLTIVTELRDDDGETVATATSTLIERAEG